jgi:hypothetical protein
MTLNITHSALLYLVWGVVMLSVTFLYCFVECHYAECRYPECCGIISLSHSFSLSLPHIHSIILKGATTFGSKAFSRTTLCGTTLGKKALP